MNFIKRAWFAVIRKPARSIILLIIFFTVANLVLSGIAIQRATQKASDVALQQLTGTITFSFNTQKAREEAMSSAAATSSSSSDNRFMVNITEDPLTEAMVEKVAKQKNILDYNIIVSTSAMANNFKQVAVSSSSFSTSSSSSSDAQRQNQFQNQQQNFQMPDVSIVGLRSSELYTDFDGGTSKLDSGSTAIKPADNGKKVCIISSDLAKANSLKVGDSIQIYASGSSDIITLKIIGTYTATSTSPDTTGFGDFGKGGRGNSLAFMQSSNKIYTDYGTALKLKSDASSSSGIMPMGGSSAPQINSAVYYLDDPKNMTAAQTEIKKISGIDWNKFQITTDTSAYDQEVKPIKNVASFAKMIIWVVAIVGALILALILLLNVRERMFETGVLLSMGESKFKLLMQFMAEMLIIAVIAFGASYFSGGYISQKLGNYLITQEITNENAQTSAAIQSMTGGNGSFTPGNYGGTAGNRLNMMRNFGGVNKTVKPISSITVDITIEEMLKVCLAGLIIILLATAVPAVSIMRYKPRSILSRAG